MRPRKPKSTDEGYKTELALTGSTATTGWVAAVYRFDIEARREWWEQHKAGILKDWIQQHPGTRPFEWWVFDSPGMRRKLSEPGPSNDEIQEMGGHSIFGIPCLYDDPYEIRQNEPVFENQAAFLKRHGLMTVAESRRVNRAVLKPERLRVD